METSTHHSFNYPRVFYAHRHRLRIIPVIGLIFVVFAYLQNKPPFKTFDPTETDLDAVTERPADLWTERASHNLSGTPARISPIAAKHAFFTHLLDQGKQQLQRQEFAQALNSFEKALVLDSRDPTLYYLLAELHRALGRYKLSDQFRELGDTLAIRPKPVSVNTVANAELTEAAIPAPVNIEMSVEQAARQISLDGSHPN
jgi:tetratricopeptide (TPR) repeat protein